MFQVMVQSSFAAVIWPLQFEYTEHYIVTSLSKHFHNLDQHGHFFVTVAAVEAMC